MERRNSMMLKASSNAQPPEFNVKKLITEELGIISSTSTQSNKSGISKNSSKDKNVIGMNLGNQSTIFTRQFDYQAIILHTNPEDIPPLTTLQDSYSLAISPIVNKPLIAYQIEYLQKYGINDIMISVVKNHASKVEKYIRTHFKNCNPKQNLELIVFQEEKEHIEVLSLI